MKTIAFCQTVHTFVLVHVSATYSPVSHVAVCLPMER
jgi:hypothetical protein